MKTSLYSIPAAILIALASSAYAQTDSTGASTGGISNYGDVIASSTWNRISGKPATATRWPRWSEVTNKPSTFPPASHNHDSRYIRQDSSGSISGNLSVSGTVTGNRVVTGDVGGDRWCRATSSGRIQCTHSTPSSENQILAGWPNTIHCNGHVFYLQRTNRVYGSHTLVAYATIGYSPYSQSGIGSASFPDIYFYRDTGNYFFRPGGSSAVPTNCRKNPKTL